MGTAAGLSEFQFATMKAVLCLASLAVAAAELKGHWDWSTETLQVNVKRALANAKGDQITTGIGWKEVDFSNRGKWNSFSKKDQADLVKHGAKSWAIFRNPEGENQMVLSTIPASEAGRKSPEFLPDAKFCVMKGPEGLDMGADVVTAQFRVAPHPAHKKKPKKEEADLEREEKRVHAGFHKWTVWKEWHQGQWTWPKWSESEPDMPLNGEDSAPTAVKDEAKPAEAAPAEAAPAPAPANLERDFMSLERDVENLAENNGAAPAQQHHPWFGLYDWGVWYGASPYVFQKAPKASKK